MKTSGEVDRPALPPCDEVDGLMRRINAFPLSEQDAEIGFEEKLAREQCWTLGYARRVVREYRRFLWLTQVAGTPMCPSADVDEAWHLHIRQTRSYRMMCEQVLGRFLHHEASKESEAELERHKTMYTSTLEAYARWWGGPPPADIWPDVVNRFRSQQEPPKAVGIRLPVLFGSSDATLKFVIASALVGGWAFMKGVGVQPWLSSGDWAFSGLFVLSGAVVLLGYVVWRSMTLQAKNAVPVLDPYEAAWLSGGHERVNGAVISSLVQRGWLILKAERKDKDIVGGACHRGVTFGDPEADRNLDVIERACLRTIGEDKLDIEVTRRALVSQREAIALRLQRAGLMIGQGYIAPGRLIAGGLMLVLLIVGSARFMEAIAVGRWLAGPLPLLLLIAAMFARGLLVAERARSVKGEQALQRTRERYSQLEAGVPQVPGGARDTEPGGLGLSPAALTAMAFGLFGTKALMADPMYAGINFIFPDDSGNVTGNSGSAAGCGGGCSGCGGCGGCGG